MKTHLTIAIAVWAAAGTAWTAPDVYAECSHRWSCDEKGDCRRVYDCPQDRNGGIIPPRIEPIDPPRIKPIVPPSIKPIMPPTIPPIGRKSCDLRRMCDDDGTCRWEKVCE